MTERTAVDPHAAMHTAEHILNAIMQRDFGGGRSIEAHLDAKKSKCDYEVSRPLDESDARRIEGAVNDEIQADHSVTTFTVDRAEAETRFDMGKVPPSAIEIRIVKIGDLDVIPCVGDHASHTAQLGRFVIRSISMRNEHVVRIRFALDLPQRDRSNAVQRLHPGAG